MESQCTIVRLKDTLQHLTTKISSILDKMGNLGLTPILTASSYKNMITNSTI